jgi:hypothetical protein
VLRQLWYTISDMSYQCPNICHKTCLRTYLRMLSLTRPLKDRQCKSTEGQTMIYKTFHRNKSSSNTSPTKTRWSHNTFLRIYSLFFWSWIYELLPFTVLGLKTCYIYYGTFGYRTTAGVFKTYFDFQNFQLTTRLRWLHYYIL